MSLTRSVERTWRTIRTIGLIRSTPSHGGMKTCMRPSFTILFTPLFAASGCESFFFLQGPSSPAPAFAHLHEVLKSDRTNHQLQAPSRFSLGSVWESQARTRAGESSPGLEKKTPCLQGWRATRTHAPGKLPTSRLDGSLVADEAGSLPRRHL